MTVSTQARQPLLALIIRSGQLRCSSQNIECKDVQTVTQHIIPKQRIAYPLGLSTLGLSGGSREPRLLVTSQLQHGFGGCVKGIYIALRYGWVTKETLTTRLETFALMQEKIPWEELPLTMRDVLEVARALKSKLPLSRRFVYRSELPRRLVCRSFKNGRYFRWHLLDHFSSSWSGCVIGLGSSRGAQLAQLPPRRKVTSEVNYYIKEHGHCKSASCCLKC